MIARVFTLGLLLAGCFGAAAAADGVADLPEVQMATVRAVTAPFVLTTEGGDAMRLAGIGVPPGNHERVALAELQQLAVGRQVSLRSPSPRTDRHGRIVGQVVRDDGLWLQEDLVRRGLVHVLPLPGERVLARSLLPLEDEARRAERGLWADRRQRPVPAHRVDARDAGRFMLIEGAVLEAAEVRGTVYLNFGADWRGDFTVMIPHESTDAFTTAGFDVLALKGRKIRVRGWVRSYNGPMIVVDHPDWLEALGQSGDGGR